MSTPRRILKLHDSVTDEWRYPGESAQATDPQVLPLAELAARTAAHEALPERLGVLLAPADAVENLAPYIGQLSLVVVDFPGFSEGRGFTQGRLLRLRHHFQGELRARGAGVKQDKVLLLARCGFDAFDLAASDNEQEAGQALSRYTVAYQDGDSSIPLRRRAPA
jgi:uncharacterized protein (DUF934 family)